MDEWTFAELDEYRAIIYVILYGMMLYTKFTVYYYKLLAELDQFASDVILAELDDVIIAELDHYVILAELDHTFTHG